MGDRRITLDRRRDSTDSGGMTGRQLRVVCLAALLSLLGPASTAWADITAFLGVTPQPSTRPVRGFSFGLNFVVIGFELDYGHSTERPADGAPGLTTTMINGLVQTPTSKTQLYLTAGGGFYRERLNNQAETSVGTNIGGGLKIALVGPLRLRLDYRVFRLRGTPIAGTPQRAYAGLNLAF